MKSILLSVSFYLIVITGFPQDSLWKTIKIDENLTIDLPGNIEKTDTVMKSKKARLRIHAYRGDTDNSIFIVTVTPNGAKINVDNPESLQEAYKGVERGILNKMKGQNLNHLVADTSINDIQGKHLKFYPEVLPAEQIWEFYVFLVNDKLYTITCFFSNGITNDEHLDLKKLLNSIRFTATNIREQKFSSKTESTGFKVGEMVGYFLMLALFVGLVIYLVKRFS